MAAHVLDRFFYAFVGYVVVVAKLAKRITTTFDTAIRTDRSSTVGTFGHGRLAARHSDVRITGYKFDLAELVHLRRLCQLLQLCEQFTSALKPPFVFAEFLRCVCSLTQKLGLVIQKYHQFVADLGAARTREPPPRKPVHKSASPGRVLDVVPCRTASRVLH